MTEEKQLPYIWEIRILEHELGYKRYFIDLEIDEKTAKDLKIGKTKSITQ